LIHFYKRFMSNLIKTEWKIEVRNSNRDIYTFYPDL